MFCFFCVVIRVSRLYRRKRFLDNKILLEKLPLSNSVIPVPPPAPHQKLLFLLSEPLIDKTMKNLCHERLEEGSKMKTTIFG